MSNETKGIKKEILDQTKMNGIVNMMVLVIATGILIIVTMTSVIMVEYLDSIATGISLILEADTPTASTPWEHEWYTFEVYPDAGKGIGI